MGAFKRTVIYLAVLFIACALTFGCRKYRGESSFLAEVYLEGGSGKSGLQTPAAVITKDGRSSVVLVFKSTSYDYVILDGTKYLNENAGGYSTFTLPVTLPLSDIHIAADTTAMSVPHEVSYTVRFTGDLSSFPDSEPKSNSSIQENSYGQENAVRKALSELGIESTGYTRLEYARQFTVEKYGKISLISIKDSGTIVVVPEDFESAAFDSLSKKIPSSVLLLRQPLDKAYIVSSAAMDFTIKTGAIGMSGFCATRKDGWYLPAARQAMDNGKLLYAGKYSAPDYELLLLGGCNLAIENTMILHSPQVKEKLEQLGIPVVIERSSYEENPLGRLEWIKFYGALFGKESEAESFFGKKLAEVNRVLSSVRRQTDNGDRKTGVFFFVNSNGTIGVKKSGDYIARMIEMAGGKYALDGVSFVSGSSGGFINMQAEDFYALCMNADFLIYSSMAGDGLKSIDELIKKNSMFADFKAVKAGEVYCPKRVFFQESTGLADFIVDLHGILAAEQETGGQTHFAYLEKIPG